MSRIDELIAELCPSGVSVHRLGDIATLLRGNGMPRTMLLDTGVGAIHYGQIYTKYGTWTEATISFVSEDDAKKLTKADPGDLIITNTSENLEDIGKAVAWLGDSQIVTGGHATVIKHKFEPKFLAYWFQTPDFFTQKKKLATGTKVIDVSAKKLEQIIVPFPPLEIQREIVRILDTFSKMEAELEAELEARKQQYEHYSWEKLEGSDCVESAPRVTVGELSILNRGAVISKDYLTANPGPYPVYSSQTANEGIFGYIDNFAFDDAESITWTTDGANAGSVFFHVNKRFNITNVCGRIVTNDSRVNLRYLYYQLRHRAKRYVHAGMGNPKLMANHMRAIPIPMPSLDTQRHVVEVLDQFDALVNDLSIGLPAELAARRQQYEYYRDELLTFKELEPAS